MKTTQIKSIGLTLMVLAGLTLGAATSAQAGRGGHHGHGHHGHHQAHRHHDNGYRAIYNQPRVYYNRQHYPQPAYNYYPAAPAYGYPGNMTLGINTGNASFMIRY